MIRAPVVEWIQCRASDAEVEGSNPSGGIGVLARVNYNKIR